MLSRMVDAIAHTVRPHHRAASWWAATGGLLAAGTAPLAAIRLGYSAAVPFALVAAVEATLAVGCRRAWRWALAVTRVVLASQVFDVAGAAWAIIANPDGAKADELRQLGINPRLGFAINLIYSSLGVALVIVMVRARARHRAPLTTV